MTERARVRLSVVIPAHNSAAVIADTVTRIRERLDGTPAEIIVVENGSADDTLATCRRIADSWDGGVVAFSVIQSPKGMGNALRTGILASRGTTVLLTADDLPFGFDDLDGLNRIELASGGRRPPVVIGSKSHPDSRVDRGLLRAILTWGFTVLRRATLGMRTGDPQGTLVIEGELLRALAPTLGEPGFLFTTELVHVVERMGLRPIEVPVSLQETHRYHASRVSTWDAVAMGIGLVRLRHRHRSLSRTNLLATRPRG